MKNHLKFLPGEQREFLLSIQEKSKLSTDKLAKIVGVVGRSFRDWKREKLNISLKAARLLSYKYKIKLPENENILLSRWLLYKKEISRKGGYALFKKHGSPATLEGRKKGGSKTLSILRAKGIIPQPKIFQLPKSYSKEMAEFVGILLGDGGIGFGQTCITLNKEADADYVKFVSKTGHYLFGQRVRLLERKGDKGIRLYWNGVMLQKYLLTIGLKVGNKVKQQVDVPEWIKLVNEYRICCLRGLMDTDGGVFIHKYKVNGKLYKYKKICFTNRSVPLLNFVNNTLEELKFTPKMITKVENKKVWLYNCEEVEKYLRIVGTHNTRLLKHQKESGLNGKAASC